jgi:hypothetical protein
MQRDTSSCFVPRSPVHIIHYHYYPALLFIHLFAHVSLIGYNTLIMHVIFVVFALGRGGAYGRGMAHVVSRWPLTAEARVRAQIIPCGICDVLVALGQGFLRVLRFSLSVSSHRCSVIICNLEDEQSACWRQLFRETVSLPIDTNNIRY